MRIYPEDSMEKVFFEAQASRDMGIFSVAVRMENTQDKIQVDAVFTFEEIREMRLALGAAMRIALENEEQYEKNHV